MPGYVRAGRRRGSGGGGGRRGRQGAVARENSKSRARLGSRGRRRPLAVWGEPDALLLLRHCDLLGEETEGGSKRGLDR